MHRISAALACLAVVVTAGCGTAQATTPGHPAPPPCPGANNVITQADSGKTYCVRVGDQVTIILHSTRKNLWLEPLTSDNALEGVPNGAASLVVGATGAWYQATRPGRSVVTSESGVVVATSLFGDVSAALREHGSATLDDRCC